MKSAADWVYTLMRLKQDAPEQYIALVQFGVLYTSDWDDPVFNPADF